jgi:DUF438 domain-containing protein
MNKSIITTKYGVFEVVNNGNGGTSLYVEDTKICEFPKVHWADKDAIDKAVEQHHEVIEQRIKERVNVKVTRENAAEVVAQLIDVLGNENKGFYASRLKQCLNKLSA